MAMKWEELSDTSRSVMKVLGGFTPTFDAGLREVKGYVMHEDGDPGKKYYSAIDLRVIADGCIEVADWLDQRAAESAP